MTILRNIFAAIVLLFVSNVSAYAYDFEVDGIYYNIINEGNEVEVAKDPRSASSTTTKYRGNFVIPDTIEYNGKKYTVTAIGSHALSSRSFTSISIPQTVKTIKDHAFAVCKVTETINLPSGLLSIGDWAFERSEINNLTIPDSVTDIGEAAFYCCSGLTNIILPSSLTTICNRTFYGCLYQA